MDSKCYSLAYEFVCQLLQPVCFQQKMILPCRDFCTEFLDDCGNILPGELKERIRCDDLAAEADGPGSCISKPGMKGLTPRQTLAKPFLVYRLRGRDAEL